MTAREKLAQRREARQKKQEVIEAIYELCKHSDQQSSTVWQFAYNLFLDCQIDNTLMAYITDRYAIYNRLNCETITRDSVIAKQFFSSVNDSISSLFQTSAADNRLTRLTEAMLETEAI